MRRIFYPHFPHCPHFLKTAYLRALQANWLFLFSDLYAIIHLLLNNNEIGDIMSCLTIYKDSYIDATLISNQFIDEYMKDANDAQLKVYLYLVRLMCANLTTSISDIADKFNHTEKDVIRALKYWEKNKLLSLDYDEVKNLTGVHLKELDPKPKGEHLSLTETSIKAASKAIASVSTIVSDTATDSVALKPTYSLDELKTFKEQEEAQQILFIAEQYIGKTLSPTEMKSILYLYDGLDFSADLIDYLIQYCVGRGKKDFRYIEKVAVSWAEAKVKTPKQAASISSKYDKTVYTIMTALGKSSAPISKEVDYITKWTKTYGYSLDIILEACDRTVLAVDTHRFEYADGVLTNWYKSNIHHLADVKSADEKFRKSKTPVSVSKNAFNQFQQNDYDFDEIERKLLQN